MAALQLLRGFWEMVVSMVSAHLSAGTVWLSILLDEGLFSAPFCTLMPITDSRSSVCLLNTVSFLSQCVLSHLREDVLIFDSRAAKVPRRALSDENGKRVQAAVKEDPWDEIETPYPVHLLCQGGLTFWCLSWPPI